MSRRCRTIFLLGLAFALASSLSAQAICTTFPDGSLHCSCSGPTDYLPEAVTHNGDIYIDGPTAYLVPEGVTTIESTGGSVYVNATIAGAGQDGVSAGGPYWDDCPAILEGTPGTRGASLILKATAVGSDCVPQRRGSVFIDGAIDLRGGNGGNGATCNHWDEGPVEPGGNGGAGGDAGLLHVFSAQDIVFVDTEKAYLTASGGSGGAGADGGWVYFEALGGDGGTGGQGGAAGEVALHAHSYGRITWVHVEADGGQGGSGGHGHWSAGPSETCPQQVLGGRGGNAGVGGLARPVAFDAGMCPEISLGAKAGAGGSGGDGAYADAGYGPESSLGGAGGSGACAGTASAGVSVRVRYPGTMWLGAATDGGAGGDGGCGGEARGNDGGHPEVTAGSAGGAGLPSGGGSFLLAQPSHGDGNRERESALAGSPVRFSVRKRV